MMGRNQPSRRQVQAMVHAAARDQPRGYKAIVEETTDEGIGSATFQWMNDDVYRHIEAHFDVRDGKLVAFFVLKG